MTNEPDYYMPYKPYIPKTVGELIDLLGSMTLDAPSFKDRLRQFDQTPDTEFGALNSGLDNVRMRIGEEAYRAARELSDRARALFEADPDDKDPDNRGRKCFFEMEDVLKAAVRRQRSAS
jgi:hypothetical protein